jgi:multiple sugar transport system ATP-binding protein
MAELKLNHIYKVYENGHKAVNDFCIDIKDKEFIVFVGPSGCGKSTTLRMIAGLEKITAGDLFIGDVLVNDMEPKDRDIAMVFQNYALYPHMSVYENMAFGLRNRHVPEAVIKEKVLEAARILDITDYLDRKPKAMSGGQRQRVALGRAIVRDPKVFLLDEPLSNLDAKLRAQMRTEITKLHKKLQTTFIYVTHDQVEAMTMGTRIVVMKLGYVQQIDTPMNLYNKPYNKFVAGFIGTPQMNFFDVTLKRDKEKVAVAFPDGSTIKLDYEAFAKIHNSYLSGDKPAILGIRPDHITISDKETGLKCRVTAVEHLGNESIIYGDLGGESNEFTMKDEGKSIIVKTTQDTEVQVDDVINLFIREDKIHLFDKETEITLIQDVPSYNFVEGKFDGKVLSAFGGKAELPSAVINALGENKDLALEIPPAAIVAGNSYSLKVARVEELEGKRLAHLAFEDRYIFALVDESVKEGSTYKFDIQFDKCKIFAGEQLVLEPLSDNESLLGKFVKKDISRTEVEFYYAIAGEQIHDSLGNGFKINSVDGNECYKKTYKYVFNRNSIKVALDGQGIKGEILELFDYGHVKYAKLRVEEQELLVIVPNDIEPQVGQNVFLTINGEDIEVWEPVNDFRIC